MPLLFINLLLFITKIFLSLPQKSMLILNSIQNNNSCYQILNYQCIYSVLRHRWVITILLFPLNNILLIALMTSVLLDQQANDAYLILR